MTVKIGGGGAPASARGDACSTAATAGAGAGAAGFAAAKLVVEGGQRAPSVASTAASPSAFSRSAASPLTSRASTAEERERRAPESFEAETRRRWRLHYTSQCRHALDKNENPDGYFIRWLSPTTRPHGRAKSSGVMNAWRHQEWSEEARSRWHRAMPKQTWRADDIRSAIVPA
eukprot:TRINITY_DN3688_c0_g1_i1.p1 TRINITY_DN3688_c0_g1~~TRINITY_DN3688_c0_g1_i1.p1  ORF type:complete len:194 (-),score=30.89 TRINITY_DN3688_c0_g1_i1:57-578(-)